MLTALRAHPQSLDLGKFEKLRENLDTLLEGVYNTGMSISFREVTDEQAKI